MQGGLGSFENSGGDRNNILQYILHIDIVILGLNHPIFCLHKQ